MSTILYPSIAYGPVHSRRLGISLGVNLMPVNQKVCSFECIYCECGFTKKVQGAHIPTREEVRDALRSKLLEMRQAGEGLDVFTFAGNGEPTMHPQFKEVIEDTIAIRNELYPSAKISVLSNATMLHKQSVVEALKMVDNNILKLDSGIDATAKLMDGPRQPEYSIARLIEQLKQFNGDFTMQTIFLRGEVDGQKVDNTTPEEIAAWVDAVRKTNPKKVMVYQVDRESPVKNLEKLTNEELDKIAEHIRVYGFDVMVA